MASTSNSNGGDLATFLGQNKADFLRDFGASQDLSQWVIVMGNEAGDLDSIASAIGYAYFAAQTPPRSIARHYLPLYQANSEDLILRPENTEAFRRANLDSASHILFLDDLQGQEADLLARGIKFALVDGNNLPPRFHKPEVDISQAVVGIIDHHEDLGSFKIADPRTIQVPTGSCASLVTESFRASAPAKSLKVPKELADLLISAIIIDTGNLKPQPKGKAVKEDITAVEYLFPLSSFASPEADLHALSATSEPESAKDPREFLSEWHSTLVDKKYDLSPLKGRDLLRRDYKEYESEVKHIRYGLASVPMALQEWLDRPEIDGKWENIIVEMDRFGHEQSLNIVGVLTSYFQAKKNGGTKKGREQLYLVRDSAQHPVSAQALLAVFPVLAEDATLELAELRIGNPRFASESRWSGKVFTYEQENTAATRKQVAPALKRAVEVVEQQ